MTATPTRAPFDPANTTDLEELNTLLAVDHVHVALVGVNEWQISVDVAGGFLISTGPVQAPVGSTFAGAQNAAKISAARARSAFTKRYAPIP